MRLEIDNWRWSGVPFFIRAGKALPVTVTEVRVVFNTTPWLGFVPKDAPRPEPNQLVLRIGPKPGARLRMQAKDAEKHALRSVQLDMEFASMRRRGADAVRGAPRRGDARQREQLRPPGRGRGDVARRPAAARLAAPGRGLRARHLGARPRRTSSPATTEDGGIHGCRDGHRPPMTPLRERPSWVALERHHAEIRDRHLRDLFAEDASAGRAARRGGRRHLPGLLEEPRDRRDAAAPPAARGGVGPPRAHRGDVPGRAHQHDREPLRPPRRLADAQGQLARRRRARRRRETSTRCSTAWPRSRRASARATGRGTRASRSATS